VDRDLEARDVARLKGFYAPTMSAFYRARNVSREFALADKADQFRRAEVLSVRADAADIALPPDGRSVALAVRKRYEISGGALNRVGEVVSELRWARSPSGWVITSERDLTVPSQARRALRRARAQVTYSRTFASVARGLNGLAT
jgi:hypothetical protein